MVLRNVHGGKSYKKGKTRKMTMQQKIDVDVESGTDFYGSVLKLLGGKRVQVKLHDGREVQVLIPGKMYNRVWIRLGTILQINQDYEIVRIVKTTDRDAQDANDRIEKATDTGELGITFGVKKEESDNEDDCIALKPTIIEKKQQQQTFKTNDKNRTLARTNGKEGRVFYDPTLETSQYNDIADKVDKVENKDKDKVDKNKVDSKVEKNSESSDDSEEFNIADI